MILQKIAVFVLLPSMTLTPTHVLFVVNGHSTSAVFNVASQAAPLSAHTRALMKIEEEIGVKTVELELLLKELDAVMLNV